MPNVSHANLYLDFIAQALHASGDLRDTVKTQSSALLEAVDTAAARMGLVDAQAQAIAGKFGFKGMHFGPQDPLTRARALHEEAIENLNSFWNEGACDLEALSIERLPAKWLKKIEDHVVTSLQMIRDIEHRLELFPNGWEHRLQQSKIELVSHDTLEPARVHHEAEHLLAHRVSAWEALKEQGSVALIDLHAFATAADTQVLQEKIAAAQVEQEKLCAKVVKQREQAEEARLQQEQRRRDEERRLAEERKLEAKRKIEEEQRREKERQGEERRRIEEERLLAERKKQEAQWEQERQAREDAIRREQEERAARLKQESAQSGKVPGLLIKAGGVVAAFLLVTIVVGLFEFGGPEPERPTPNRPQPARSSGSSSGYLPDPAWMQGGLYGSDNDVAALKRVTITGSNGDYRVHISNQFAFTCRIYFDANGEPARLSDCTSGDPGWYAEPETFPLNCSSPGGERVCSGRYVLRNQTYASDSEMKIARRL